MEALALSTRCFLCILTILTTLTIRFQQVHPLFTYYTDYTSILIIRFQQVPDGEWNCFNCMLERFSSCEVGYTTILLYYCNIVAL